jgi:predicted dehydrogenase
MTVGIALVGCGQIAAAHFKAIAATAETRLVYTVDNYPERARSAAERHGATHWTTAYEEALSSPEVDAVLLCLPHDLHHPFTLQAAAAGKHILVEKPMALDEVEAQAMVAAAEEASVQLSIGQSSRCIPTYAQAKELLDQNAIGPVLNILHQRTFWIEQLSTPWRRDVSACGGLYLPLFGSHDIDALLWFLRDTPERVWGSIRATSDASAGDSDGFIGLELTSGALASLAFSTRCQRTRTETLFIGEKGNLVLTRSAVELNGEPVELGEREDAFTRQLRLFIQALIDNRKVPAPGREVLKVMRTLDLIKNASETGQTQTF